MYLGSLEDMRSAVKQDSYCILYVSCAIKLRGGGGSLRSLFVSIYI